MAHEITESDSLVLVGQPAWHGLGVVVPRSLGMTVREGVSRALPWEVGTEPLYGAQGAEYPAQGVYREDPTTGDRTPLTTVGPNFQPLQNTKLGELAEIVEKKTGATLETVGSIQGGRKVFVLLRTGEYGLGVGGSDVTATYFGLLNGHDAGRAFLRFHTSVRIVCANTEAQAVAGAESSGKLGRILHDSNLDAQVDQLAKELRAGILLGRAEEENRAMADQGLGLARDVASFFSDVYGEAVESIPLDNPSASLEERGEWEKRRKVARQVVLSWVEEFEHERQAAVAGTVFAGLQAVTHWADHQRPRVRDVANDRLFGRGAQIKATARKLALELV